MIFIRRIQTISVHIRMPSGPAAPRSILSTGYSLARNRAGRNPQSGCSRRMQFCPTKVNIFASPCLPIAMFGRSSRCTRHGRTKHPSDAVTGTKTSDFCCGHANDRMVDVVTKRCTHHGCTTAAELWCGRYQQGRPLVWTRQGRDSGCRSQNCAHRGSTTPSSYGVNGSKTVERC